MKPDWLVPQWEAPASVCAAFSLRTGGASVAPLDSLNLGTAVGDDRATVQANRIALRAALRLPAEPLWLQQVHGAAVVDADALPRSDLALPADASITRTRGRVLAVMVADCLPVLFASTDAAVIGAAHAGWRGLAAGVLEATVAAMHVDGDELCAWLGPAIRQSQFEVGDEVRGAFLAHDPAAAAAFMANARGRWQCDLVLLARQRLASLGVGRVADCGCCTATDPRRFYSHRRDGRTGRMAALLWLKS